MIEWINVEHGLPQLDEKVLVALMDGKVTWGMRSEVCKVKKNNQGFYYNSSETEIQWGQEENGFEYWNQLENVEYWSYFPKHPYNE